MAAPKICKRICLPAIKKPPKQKYFKIQRLLDLHIQ